MRHVYEGKDMTGREKLAIVVICACLAWLLVLGVTFGPMLFTW